MKKFLAIFILLALPGCFGQPEQPQQPVNTEVNADSILDGQIYTSAVQANDAKQCEQIKDAAKKEECGKVVEGNILTAQALEKMDEGLCDGIKIERQKGYCVIQIKKTEQTIRRIEEEKKWLTEQTKKDDAYATEARLKGDLLVCEKITDQNIRTACKTSVVIDMANKKKDKTVCESLENTSQVKTCKEMVDF